MLNRDLLTRPPCPTSSESHETYLGRLGLLGRGFVYREVVRDDPAHLEPPRRLWQRQVSALVLAHALRARMIRAGAHGLALRAAYRPQGGEARSLHKLAAAVDLDLLPADCELAEAFAQVAAELWEDLRDLPVGVGTYAPEGALYTRRVHLDYGFRHRAWQGTGTTNGTRTWSPRPAIVALALRRRIADASGPTDESELVPVS